MASEEWYYLYTLTGCPYKQLYEMGQNGSHFPTLKNINFPPNREFSYFRLGTTIPS